MVNRRLDKEIRFRVNQKLEQKIKSAAKAKDKTTSDFLRQALREYLAFDEMENRKDSIQSFVAKAIEEKLRPVENRLAKITAKSAMAAAMTMYVEAALLSQYEKDVVNIFREARQKAVVFVQSGIPNTGQLESWVKNASRDDDI